MPFLPTKKYSHKGNQKQSAIRVPRNDSRGGTKAPTNINGNYKRTHAPHTKKCPLHTT